MMLGDGCLTAMRRHLKAREHSFSNWAFVLDIFSFSSRNAFIYREKSAPSFTPRLFALPWWGGGARAADEWMNEWMNESMNQSIKMFSSWWGLTSTLALVSDWVFDELYVAFQMSRFSLLWLHLWREALVYASRTLWPVTTRRFLWSFLMFGSCLLITMLVSSVKEYGHFIFHVSSCQGHSIRNAKWR
jgi:hypothetical protein